MLSNIVNNDVAKKAVFDKVVTKVNTIDTNEFVLKTQYNSDKSGFQKKIDDAFKKIPDASGFGKKNIIILRSLRLKVKYLVLLA